MKFARKTGLCSVIAIIAWAMVAVTPQVASAAPQAAPGSPNWAALQQLAVHAVAGARHDGPVTVTAVLTDPATGSSMTLASGATVTSATETVEAADSGGSYVVNLALLGGQQLVVTILGTPSTILVLSPGTAHVSQALTVHGTTQRVASDGVTPMNSGTGTCFEVIANPIVIGSIYGPLIDGYMFIDCFGGQYHNISAYGVLDDWVGGAHTIGSGGGTVYAPDFAFNVYAPCYAGGPNDFLSQLIFTYDGSPIYGGTSAWAVLDCAQP